MSGARAIVGSGTLMREWLPPLFDYLTAQHIRTRGTGANAQGPCPICGSSDAASYNRQKNVFHCFSCGDSGDVLALHRRTHGLGHITAARELGCWQEAADGQSVQTQRSAVKPVALQPGATEGDKRTLAYISRLRPTLREMQGTTTEAYLLSRKCALPPADGGLRHHDGLAHESGGTWPAMVGLITNAITGEAMGWHRTWHTGAGGKAPVTKSKMALGPKKGGVVRLWPDEFVTSGLAIAEGIETALSMAHDYKPVWSSLDAGNLADFPVLAGIETLVIGADNDPAGIKAASECANRWAAAGVEVQVIAPIEEGDDWNDGRAP